MLTNMSSGDTDVVCNDNQEKKGELERCWSDLPVDIIDLIRLYLFARDSSAFNATCRSWRSTTAILRPLPPPGGCPHRQSPCLMFIEKFGICKFFHPIYNDFYFMEIPEIANARLRYSRFGWLLLSQEDSSTKNIFFFNPFTRIKIELPRIPFEDGFVSLCFTAPPTSSDCVVMGVSGFLFYSVAMIRLGDQNWSIDENDKKFRLAECHPILYRGRYYCLGADGNVGIYNPKDHTCDVILKPLDTKVIESLRQAFFAEFDGKLLAVFVYGHEREVHVWRLNLSKMNWFPVQSLGDKMLFVSRGSSFVETASVSGIANKIYFSKFYGNSGVFYSLSTKKYHSYTGGFSSHTGHKLRDFPLSTWIKPTLEMG
ncbi:hypothetical protein ACH5RR_041426 [Cinchona calisaya]|uniref:KIB1-4 beta-propeller domain-containing protein n=1 Tax=Cinchona calisaya TaxID=153742 RepID=A0ABD2XZE5_9GENT